MTEIVAGFILGIFFGSFLKFFWPIPVFLFLSFILFFYKKQIGEKENKILLSICFILIGISVGFFRIYFSDLNKKSQLVEFVGIKTSAEGIIFDEPDIREDGVNLVVKLYKIEEKNISEKILLKTDFYPKWKYGDKIKIENLKLSEPKNIESDDGRIFNYTGYLKVRGIWYTAKYVKISLIENNQGNKIKSILFSIKEKFISSLERNIVSPESSLMSGILIGAKQSLGKNLLNEFSRAGVSHIVVLSGYNIAIVAKGIMSALKFFPSAISFSFGCLGIILFTIFSGGGASAVRASIMVLVALFADKFGRDYKAGRVLGFAIVLMLSSNPALLVFDPSFQLSILATIGLVFVSPILLPYFSKITEKFGMREIISSTISTQLTVLPFLVYNTGIFSIISLPINILILGIIPLTMFLGFITGILGIISQYLAFLPSFLSFILLKYQLLVVHVGSSMQYGIFQLSSFSPIILIFIYTIIFSVLFKIKKRKI